MDKDRLERIFSLKENKRKKLTTLQRLLTILKPSKEFKKGKIKNDSR